ncbi:MAG: hypothetical protein WA709_09465 [Stellaceae bacterium]
MENRHRPGTVVSVRGRKWIVLLAREPEVLRLRPLTTAQGEEVGLFLRIQGDRVRPARWRPTLVVSVPEDRLLHHQAFLPNGGWHFWSRQA